MNDEQVIEKPANNASKSDWAAYAISQGMDEADAEDMTRNELASAYADDSEDTSDAKEQVKAAYKAGAALDGKPDTAGEALMQAGAQDLPPDQRVTAVHRAIKP